MVGQTTETQAMSIPPEEIDKATGCLADYIQMLADAKAKTKQKNN